MRTVLRTTKSRDVILSLMTTHGQKSFSAIFVTKKIDDSYNNKTKRKR